MSGYDALHESAAWADASSRTKIRVTGEDRVTWLQAMCTNDAAVREPGQGAYAFFLNNHGHILADCCFYPAEDHIVLDCEPEVRKLLIEHLEKFIIMEDVTLEDVSGSLAGAAVAGPRAAEVLRRALGADAPSGDYEHLTKDGVLVSRVPWSGRPLFRLFSAAEKMSELTSELEAAGAAQASEQDLRVFRVENAVPRHGEDFGDRTLPHESQQLHAVSFRKGCYLGQEIVERVRSRGRVNKRLELIEMEAQAPPPAGSPVLFEGKEAGRLTSPVYSPRLGRSLGFAILRQKAAEAGAGLEVEGVEARVRQTARAA